MPASSVSSAIANYRPVLRTDAANGRFTLRPQLAERTEFQKSPLSKKSLDTVYNPTKVGDSQPEVSGTPKDAADCTADVISLSDSPGKALEKPVLTQTGSAFDTLLNALSVVPSSAVQLQSEEESSSESSSESDFSSVSDSEDSPNSRGWTLKNARNWRRMKVSGSAAQTAEDPEAVAQRLAVVEAEMAAAKAATVSARKQLQEVLWLEEVQDKSLSAQNNQVVELRTRLSQLLVVYGKRQAIIEERTAEIQKNACKAAAIRALQGAIREALGGDAELVLGNAQSITEMAAALEEAAAKPARRAESHSVRVAAQSDSMITAPGPRGLANSATKDGEMSPLLSADTSSLSSSRSRRSAGGLNESPGRVISPESSRVSQLPTPPLSSGIRHTTYLDDFAIRQDQAAIRSDAIQGPLRRSLPAKCQAVSSAPQPDMLLMPPASSSTSVPLQVPVPDNAAAVAVEFPVTAATSPLDPGEDQPSTIANSIIYDGAATPPTVALTMASAATKQLPLAFTQATANPYSFSAPSELHSSQKWLAGKGLQSRASFAMRM